MIHLLETLISGVSLGVIYALMALGFVIVYRSTETVNFAHGTILLGGGYVISRLREPLGFWLALLLGIAITAAFAALVEVLLIRPLRQRNARHDTAAIVTIGLNIVLTAELTRLIGSDLVHLDDPWGNEVVSLGEITVPQARVAALVIAALAIAALLLVFHRTTAGLSMRASAEDHETAELCGVRVSRVAIASWSVAGGLAALAAVFMGASPSPGLSLTTAQVALAAFPAVVIGGLDSIEGALLGGVVVGIVQSLANGYQTDLHFLGEGFGALVPWLVMVGVLLVRPSGIFGEKATTRV